MQFSKSTYLKLISAICLLFSCGLYEGPTRILPKQSKIIPEPIAPLSKQEYLGKIAREINQSIPDAQVELLNDSIKVLFPNNITYEKSAVLPKEYISGKLKKLAQLINKYDKTKILVVGHTDNQGDKTINHSISTLRAKNIKDYLLYYKAPEERVYSWGLGDNSPIATNDTEEGREKNKRVEFIILAEFND